MDRTSYAMGWLHFASLHFEFIIELSQKRILITYGEYSSHFVLVINIDPVYVTIILYEASVVYTYYDLLLLFKLCLIF